VLYSCHLVSLRLPALFPCLVCARSLSFFLLLRPPPRPPLFPYPPLFRSDGAPPAPAEAHAEAVVGGRRVREGDVGAVVAARVERSEEHTSELQSLTNLVCRLLLEKKNDVESILDMQRACQR